MQTYYCSHCGGGNPFEFTKPKFCSQCGVAFGGVQRPQVSPPKPAQQAEAEAEEDNEDVPQVRFNEDDFEFDVRNPNVFKGEDLVKPGQKGKKLKPNKTVAKAVDKKSVLNLFKSRASNSGKSTTIK